MLVTMNEKELILFEAQSGALSVRLENASEEVCHIHSIVDPEAEGGYFCDLTIWGDIVILEGTGLGYHLNKVLMGIDKKITLIILEFFKENAQLCAEYLKGLYGVDPVVITSETKNREQELQKCIDNGGLVQVVKHPASYRAKHEFYDSLLNSVLRRRPVLAQKRNSVLLSGNFFLQRELNNAVVKADEQCTVIDYTKLKSAVAYENEIQYLMQETEPDLFISVNMLGFDGNGIFTEYTSRHGVPVAIWFVDDPRPILLSKREHIRGNMTAFCWERNYIQFLKDAGFSHVEYLPLATDPELFGCSAKPERKVPFAFVGTSMAGAFRSSLRKKFLWKKETEALVYEIAEQILSDPSMDIASMIQRCANTAQVSFSDERNRVWLQSYCIHTAGMLKRKRIIESMKPFSIEIFGDADGWQELVGNGFSVHPPVDYATKLHEVYGSVSVNLNVTSSQMPTAVNQRVFDIPVSGNFLISDYQKDLDELFEKDEIVVYHSKEELAELYSRYSSDEHSCRIITQKARERILNEHTYVRRYESMRKKMFS